LGSVVLLLSFGTRYVCASLRPQPATAAHNTNPAKATGRAENRHPDENVTLNYVLVFASICKD